MKYSLAFHVIGLVFWIGGLTILTRIMGMVVKAGERSAAIGAAVRRAWLGFVIPGIIITLLSGLHQLQAGGALYYMKQGWFHAKLGAIVVLLVVSVLAGKEVKAFSQGQEVSAKRLAMLHGMSSLMLVLIVFATFVGR